jgi:hypothetical protein
MKKFIVMISALAITAFFAACNGKTELQFTNSPDTQTKINSIVWEKDNTIWEKPDGYDMKEDTESKEVSTTVSRVSCSIWDSNSLKFIDNATVIFPDGGDSLSLKSGSSNKYVLKAQP